MKSIAPDRPTLTKWVLPMSLAVMLFHASFYGGWLIDDAGITFAYARNLAGGHGLVAQVGAERVEGFSNPLWTFLIALTYASGLFVQAVTPKLCAILMVAAVMVLIFQDLSRRSPSTLASGTAVMLVAVCTPFIIWTTSGLENGLLALLVIAACRNTLAAVGPSTNTRRPDLLAGVLGGLIGLTRPDAILYTAAHGVSVAAAEWNHGPGFVSRTLRRWLWLAGGIVPVYGSYVLFRLFYFGDIVPNTYHAKQKPSIAGLLSPGKLFDLLESATGDFAWVVPFFLVGSFIVVLSRKMLGVRLIVLVSYLGVATASYLVMPADWMGEFRFATAFFPLFYWTVAELWIESVQRQAMPRAAWTVVHVIVLVFAAQVTLVFGSRAIAFRRNPPVPLTSIQEHGARGFAQLATLVDAPSPSVLTSDLGGMLLDSKLRVIDLAGLCDRTIAKAISISGSPARLHDYVFDETKPTFMHVVGTFVRLSRFHLDPRFERDYIAIYESWDGPPDWPAMWRGSERIPPAIGDYVRRDAIRDDPEMLRRLRQVYHEHSMQDSVGPWQERREGFGIQRPLTARAAAQVYQYVVQR